MRAILVTELVGMDEVVVTAVVQITWIVVEEVESRLLLAIHHNDKSSFWKKRDLYTSSFFFIFPFYVTRLKSKRSCLRYVYDQSVFKARGASYLFLFFPVSLFLSSSSVP